MPMASPGNPIKQQGQSVVEVAVLVPIILFILVGVLDLGRAFFAYVSVANAARESARYASIHPSVAEDFVRQKVLTEMGGTLELGSGANLMSVERSSPDIIDAITVTVRYSLTTSFLGPVSSLVAGFWGGPVIPNPISIVARSTIPVSAGNYAADLTAATASAVSIVIATAQTIPTSTPTQSPTATPTPATAWISLSSYVAYSGQSLTVQGCNFHPNKPVTIFWDGVAQWNSSTNASGCFGPTSFVVPVGTTGSLHTVRAETTSGATTLSATATPQLQISGTPTATSTSTSTPTQTSTATATATSTSTSTPSPTPIPIVLNVMTEGDTFVSGTAKAGVSIEVRDMTEVERPVIGTGIVEATGTFSITVSPALIFDHSILLSASNGATIMGLVVVANPTATPTSTTTGTPTTTSTSTSTPTATPPTPEACNGTAIGGTIYSPGGSKLKDAIVSLVMDGQVINTAVTGASGTYNFSADSGGTPLHGNRNYVISVELTGYTSNWTSVYLPCSQSVSAADVTLSSSTPTPTATSVPPASPTLSGACTTVGSNYYHSLSWSAVSGAANYYVYQFNESSQSWAWITTVSVTSTNVLASANSINRYYVTAVNSNRVESYPSNMVMVVCGNTPTPSPTPSITPTPTSTPTPFPDLVPYLISTDPPSGSISTGQPVMVTSVFRNQGSAPVNTLFWVDLYIDPSPAPPSLSQSGIAWQAVGSIGAQGYVTLTFSTSFSTEGAHLIYTQVDSVGDVAEGNEGNNVSNPYPVWVNAAPTATATATPLVTSTATSTPEQSPTSSPTATATPQPGSISGSTYIYANGVWSLQGRVAVSIFSGSTLVASTYSDAEGFYEITGVPPDSYSVVGEAEVGGILFSDTRPGVSVSSGTETSGVELFLMGA